MYALRGLTPTNIPFRMNAEGDYSTACSRREVIVILNAATHRSILENLFYDKRTGSRGRGGLNMPTYVVYRFVCTFILMCVIYYVIMYCYVFI